MTLLQQTLVKRLLTEPTTWGQCRGVVSPHRRWATVLGPRERVAEVDRAHVAVDRLVTVTISTCEPTYSKWWFLRESGLVGHCFTTLAPSLKLFKSIDDWVPSQEESHLWS